MSHIPLHHVPDLQSVATAGRVRKDAHHWRLFNAFADLFLELTPGAGPDTPHSLPDGALARVQGHREGDRFLATHFEVVHLPQRKSQQLATSLTAGLGAALSARHQLYQQIHAFFDDRRFLQVQTPALTDAPGTDPHLAPVEVSLAPEIVDDGQRMFLHTSPEFAMKRLLAAGSGPIYQLGRVWRDGEVTDLHAPEFTLLEWYRPWQPVDTIIDDVEALIRQVLHPNSPRPVVEEIPRLTMQEVVYQCCGFDLLKALDTPSLRAAIEERDLLPPRALDGDWDDLFFALAVTHIDPHLAGLGALFVTEWPHPLAVLARRCEHDPRVAQRFELYIDGIELANGFGELTDPREQRQRFEADNDARHRRGTEPLPVAQSLLAALEWGMPPSAGVALGVDRLLLLATPGARALADIAPLAPRRVDGQVQWP